MGTPPINGFKLNCDSDFKLNHFLAVMGGITKNHSDSPIDGFAFKTWANSPFVYEALAVREACHRAICLGPYQVIIENDRHNLIKLCYNEDAPHWEAASVIVDIRKLLQNRSFLKIAFALRDCNRVTHWLATKGWSSCFGCWWLSPTSSPCRPIIY